MVKTMKESPLVRLRSQWLSRPLFDLFRRMLPPISRTEREALEAVTVMVPNSLGPAELLLHYGTPGQKEYWLPRFARVDEIPCFALTAPEAGSDAASLPDTGV